MTLPNLPTDSLYKFVSIGSLAAILSIGFFGWSKYDQVQLRVQEAREEIAVLKVEAEALKAKGDSVTAEAVLVVQRAAEKQAAKIRNIEEMLAQLKFIQWAGLALEGAFMILGLWSIRRWFTHIQKPQDELIQLQLKEARAKVVEERST